MRRTLPLLLAAALIAQGGQGWEQRDGEWVWADPGACRNPLKLKVLADVRVSVEPARGSSAGYRYQANSRAPRAPVRISRQGEWCVITTVSEPGRQASGELRIFVPAAVRQTQLETRSGSLRVEGLRGEIAAETGAGAVVLDRLTGPVLARTGGGSIEAGAIDGSLRCLSGGGNIRVRRVTGEAVLESAGGEIQVGDAGGWLRLSTAGNIHVDRAAGDVFAFTRGGLIEVGRSLGVVSAESAGGGITIGAARGVRCESARGTIRLAEVSGSVRATTAYGHITAALTSARQLESSILATGHGDITVSVPSNLAVTVKALNETARWAGQVVSEFSEIQPRTQGAGAGQPVVAFGSLNGGGPVLMLSTSNGSIYLKRQR